MSIQKGNRTDQVDSTPRCLPRVHDIKRNPVASLFSLYPPTIYLIVDTPFIPLLYFLKISLTS